MKKRKIVLGKKAMSVIDDICNDKKCDEEMALYKALEAYHILNNFLKVPNRRIAIINADDGSIIEKFIFV